MTKDDQLDPRLADLLDEIKSASARDPKTAARARSRFLAEAVSIRDKQRHNWWTTIFQQKEKLAMNLIVSTLVIVGLLFGGGATVAAAQDELPNELLYPIKLETENLRLWFNTDPQIEIDMLMDMSQTRVQEMLKLNEMDVATPAMTTQRLELHIQDALHVAAGLDDADMQQAMLHIQTSLRTQEQLMSQTQTSDDTAQTMTQTQTMLQTRIRLVEDGLANPESFRKTIRNQEQNQIHQISTPDTIEPTTSSPPSAGNGNGAGLNAQPTPGGNDQSGNPDAGGNGRPENPQPVQDGNNGADNSPNPPNGNNTGGQGPSGPGGGQGGKP